jgi:hypothetical protein
MTKKIGITIAALSIMFAVSAHKCTQNAAVSPAIEDVR